MLTTRNNRLDPSLIPEEELAELARVFAKPDHVALIDAQGNRTHLPGALFAHFARIVRLMSERKAIVLMPEDEAFTTQAAANYLGVSRQHLVDLLERKDIPHHKVGTHRRVTFKDLLAYERRRDKTRRETLDKLAAEVDAAGLYDTDHAGEPWADYRIFLDACVLANFGVCDLLLRLSERPRLIVPHWSAEVLAEVRRTQVEKLGWPSELADSFQTKIRETFPDAAVAGYESLLPALGNDPKDRHVLAAAIHGKCPLILTFNLKHFSAEALKPWDVCASHPQDYLLILYEMESRQVTACLGEIAGRRNIEVQDVLIRLGKTLPAFSQRLLDDLG